MARKNRLRDRVAFDAPAGGKDALGGKAKTFVQQYAARAEIIHMTGSEAVEAARLGGRAVFKVKLRSCGASRAISFDWRMRNTGLGEQSGQFPGLVYDIKSVDAVTSDHWVWLVIEGAQV